MLHNFEFSQPFSLQVLTRSSKRLTPQPKSSTRRRGRPLRKTAQSRSSTSPIPTASPRTSSSPATSASSSSRQPISPAKGTAPSNSASTTSTSFRSHLSVSISTLSHLLPRRAAHQSSPQCPRSQANARRRLPRLISTETRRQTALVPQFATIPPIL